MNAPTPSIRSPEPLNKTPSGKAGAVQNARMHDPLSAEFPDNRLLNQPSSSTISSLTAAICFWTRSRRRSHFYDFPGEHWDHLRTGTPIESVVATVRHRTVRTKGALPQKTAKLVVFKLVQAAAKTWRRLKGANQLPLLIEGVTSTHGIATTAVENRAA